MNEALLRSHDLKLGVRISWSEPSIFLLRVCTRKWKWGFKFWCFSTNTESYNFNVFKEKVFICWTFFDSCAVIPLKQPIFDIFWIVAGVWLNAWKHQRADGNTILENPLKSKLPYIVTVFWLDSWILQWADETKNLCFIPPRQIKIVFIGSFLIVQFICSFCMELWT